uniref:Uncharacterized protein n=1 Tax=Lepeophtheirus salmonis TaxID=72036 RepID=A0A0K2UKG0_LEPSM
MLHLVASPCSLTGFFHIVVNIIGFSSRSVLLESQRSFFFARFSLKLFFASISFPQTSLPSLQKLLDTFD